MSENDNGLATRDELLAATTGKRRFANVTLPVSLLQVRIRSLTERELSEYQGAVIGANRGVRRSRLMDANRRLIVLCVVNADGNLVFQPGDVEVVANWDAADSGYLSDVCSRHSGLSQQDIGDLVKNSETIPAGSLVSD